MEFSRQEYWSELPFPSPRDGPNSGIEPGSSALQAESLLSETPGKPIINWLPSIFIEHLLCIRHFSRYWGHREYSRWSKSWSHGTVILGTQAPEACSAEPLWGGKTEWREVRVVVWGNMMTSWTETRLRSWWIKKMLRRCNQQDLVMNWLGTEFLFIMVFCCCCSYYF